ncbi:MAG: dTDP-4-dehydrorhamnose reductase [Bacteroidota bacterium]|nr:dTDP-4-dehydrorhamnose reductase [Bacteroidota bacterium]
MNNEAFKKTILVTGANGQLASEIKFISAKFPSYNFLFTSRQQLPVDDKESVISFFEKQQVHYCINCAAYTAVDDAEKNTKEAFRINADAAGNLASVCSDHQTKLIHISTDYVYDGRKPVALKEDDAVAPLNVYGLSKLRGEEFILNRYPSALIIRTSWVYSSYGKNFVKTILRLCKEKDKLNVINDQYGCPTYAADLAEIIMKFIEDAEDDKAYTGIVNYCNAGITTWFDFALAIKKYSNSQCEILPIASSQYRTAAQRPAHSILDTSKIKAMLNIEIPAWEDSLKKCLAILQE